MFYIQQCTRSGKQTAHLPIMIYLKIQEQLYGAVVIFALEGRKKNDYKLTLHNKPINSQNLT